MKRKHRRFIISIVVSVLCWCAYPAYWLMSEIDERQHRAGEWDVAAPTPPPPPPTITCPHCQHGTPEHSNYCTYCGKCVHVAILARADSALIGGELLIQRRLAFPVPGLEEGTVSKPLPVLHMPRTHSAVLRALEAAGSPAYDKLHSHPRLLAASVLFPSDTAHVPAVSGKLAYSQHEQDTPHPDSMHVKHWEYNDEVSNG